MHKESTWVTTDWASLLSSLARLFTSWFLHSTWPNSSPSRSLWRTCRDCHTWNKTLIFCWLHTMLGAQVSKVLEVHWSIHLCEGGRYCSQIRRNIPEFAAYSIFLPDLQSPAVGVPYQLSYVQTSGCLEGLLSPTCNPAAVHGSMCSEVQSQNYNLIRFDLFLTDTQHWHNTIQMA